MKELDWAADLSTAAASGDIRYMKAMLARVPSDVMQRALPYFEALARARSREEKLEEALVFYDQLLGISPENADWRMERAELHLRLGRPEDALVDADELVARFPEAPVGYRLRSEAHERLGANVEALAALEQALRRAPDDADLSEKVGALRRRLRIERIVDEASDRQDKVASEPQPPAVVPFEPAITGAEDSDPAMLAGLTQHLRRFSGMQSSRNALRRLDDPQWLAMWDEVLRHTRGERVHLHGSELGLFALRALHHGAAHVLVSEQHPLDARIASGICQKHLLGAWQAKLGPALASASEAERQRSFEEFTSAIDFETLDSAQHTGADSTCFIFTNLDHSLLGTGIIDAIRGFRSRRANAQAAILPARAVIHAMAVEWQYPGPFHLDAINRFRWNLHPEALDLPAEAWRACGPPVRVGEIDLADFRSASWDISLPANVSATAHAIVWWYELEVGALRLSNEPGSAFQCIRPAVQYIDPVKLESGSALTLRIHLGPTRIEFQTSPPAREPRTHWLPSWYVPMLIDDRRNSAYREALERLTRAAPVELALDIGAGCGLLSMMAARAGVARVVGCESSAAIQGAALDVLAANSASQIVSIVPKDCRRLEQPRDLPQPADLALFELFDCSLIGEGILHFLEYARKHLLAAEARYLPQSGVIRAMLVEYRIDRIWDFDANLLNPFRFSPGFQNVDAERIGCRALTEPLDVFNFDFATATAAPATQELKFVATSAGTVGAVVFWFDLRLDQSCLLSNAPGAARLHWRQGLQYLPEVRVDPGPLPTIDAAHNGSSLRFEWRRDEVPASAMSRLPRVDPTAWRIAQELEQQNAQLLHHCRQNPAEYAKVVRLAQRIALDPAAFGVDPVVAQRFAGLFLRAF